jgi:hypothetical protein
MPEVPSTNTFVNKGLNTRPTFFGCDAKNGCSFCLHPSSTSRHQVHPELILSGCFLCFRSGTGRVSFGRLRSQLPLEFPVQHVDVQAGVRGGGSSSPDREWNAYPHPQQHHRELVDVPCLRVSSSSSMILGRKEADASLSVGSVQVRRPSRRSKRKGSSRCLRAMLQHLVLVCLPSLAFLCLYPLRNRLIILSLRPFSCRDGTHDDSDPAQEYAPVVGQPPAFLNVSAKAAAPAVPAAASASSSTNNVSAGVLSSSATMAGVLASALFASFAGFALFV